MIQDGLAVHRAGAIFSRFSGLKLLRAGLAVAVLVSSSVSFGQSVDTDPEAAQGETSLMPIMVQAEEATAANVTVEGYAVDAGYSATKTYSPRIETPQIVNVVTRDQIQDQGADTINQALRYTPGVFTGLAGASSRQTTVALRGYPGGDVNNTFLDGLRLQNDPGAYANILIDPFFLERIDVAKGPSSVLYGRASQPGGLVNFVTKKPLDEQQALLRFRVGSFDTYGFGFDVTGPLPDAGLGSYRVVGSLASSGTQYDVVERQRYTLMPEVRFNLGDDTTLLLQAYLQREPEGGFHGAVPYDLSVSDDRFGRTVDDSWVDASADFAQFERETNLLSYFLTHKVNDNVTLRSQARYGTVDIDLKQVYQYGFTGNGAELVRYYTAAHEDLEAFSIDNSVLFDFDTGAIEHRVLAGFGYEQRQNDVSYASGLATPLDPFSPDYSNSGIGAVNFAPVNSRELRQFSAYIQDQMEWNRWHLVLGGRQDYVKREYHNGSTDVSAERSDDAFSTRAALLYESRWGLSPYLSYSEGFSPTTYTPVNGEVAPPSKSHQYEIGLKYQPPGVEAMFTVAFYDLTQENVQQRTQVSPATFSSVGDVRAKGIEVSARADLTNRLHVIASYTNSSIEYQDDINHSGLSIESGNTFVRTPDEQASLWLAYDFTSDIRAGVGARYVGESYANTDNTVTVPDYTVVDAFVSMDMAAFSASLAGMNLRINANNVFDNEHVASCFSELFCYYGEPRTISATLDYRF